MYQLTLLEAEQGDGIEIKWLTGRGIKKPEKRFHIPNVAVAKRVAMSRFGVMATDMMPRKVEYKNVKNIMKRTIAASAGMLRIELTKIVSTHLENSDPLNLDMVCSVFPPKLCFSCMHARPTSILSLPK
nr:hypothetical protein Iba_chr03aCG0490 [Ipomoea batatas]